MIQRLVKTKQNLKEGAETSTLSEIQFEGGLMDLNEMSK